MSYIRMHETRINFRGNYFRIRNSHLFFGSTIDPKILEKLPIRSNVNIHIFMTIMEDIGEVFRKTIYQLVTEGNERNKVIIHIPRTVVDLKPLVVDILHDMLGNKKLRICVESVGPVFTLGEKKGPHKFVVKYEDGEITYSISLGSVKTMRDNKNTAIRNEVQAKYIDAFKTKIIANFKAVTPLGILKSFKSDEDIWNYIKGEDEWKNREKKNAAVTPIRMDPITLKTTSNDPAVIKKQVEASVMSAVKDLGINIDNK